MSPRKVSRVFKDWTVGGPVPPGDPTQLPEPDAEGGPVTLNALSGLWKIHQYERGHRYSTDDLCTAWYGTTKVPSASRVLDLGSGIGSVGMMAAWRLSGARFVTIEAQDISIRLARRSAAFNGIENRYRLIHGDIRDASLLSGEEPFDLVLGSPPYFPLGTGVEGDHPQTIPCRFEVRGDVSHYCEAAARALAPGGLFAFVFPTIQLERANAAAEAHGFTVISRRDVVFREGNEPLVSLFACARTSDLPPYMRGQTWVEPQLIVRLKNGDVHPEYRTVKLTMGFRP